MEKNANIGDRPVLQKRPTVVAYIYMTHPVRDRSRIKAEWANLRRINDGESSKRS